MVAFSTPAHRRYARDLRDAAAAARKEGKQEKFNADLFESFRTKQLTLGKDIRIRSLFEETVEDGAELVRCWEDNSSQLYESGDAVTTTDFANITGQITYSSVLDKYADPQFIWDKLFTTVPTSLDGEKIPGITQIGDQALQVDEAGQYPFAGVGESWVETPSTIKRGLIVRLTKEAIFFDRTGVLQQRASDVGRVIGLNKEKRCLDVAFGITTTYRRNGGAAQATYGNSHTNGDFDNLAASNGLVDYTDIEAALLLFDAITDPDTGEPIDIMASDIVVPSALRMTLANILRATGIQVGIPGSTNQTTLTNSPNPLGSYNPITNQYVKARTSSATTWFIGDFKRAFKYMENWGPQITPASSNNHDEFHRDIVAQWKVSERGAAAVAEPRYAVKCTQ